MCYRRWRFGEKYNLFLRMTSLGLLILQREVQIELQKEKVGLVVFMVCRVDFL